MNRFSLSRNPAQCGEGPNNPPTTSPMSGSGESLYQGVFPDREPGSFPGWAPVFFFSHRPSNSSPCTPVHLPWTPSVDPSSDPVDGLDRASVASSCWGARDRDTHRGVPSPGLPAFFRDVACRCRLHKVSRLEPSIVRTVSSGSLGRLVLLGLLRLLSSLALPCSVLVKGWGLSLRGVRCGHSFSPPGWESGRAPRRPFAPSSPNLISGLREHFS